MGYKKIKKVNIIVEDYTGKRFGKWTVLERDLEKHNTRDVRWICKCDCGTIRSVLGKYLRNGKSISCGCNIKKDLTGQKFSKLTVLETLYGYNNRKTATYKCECDCGNIVYVNGSAIYKTQSCGCSHFVDDCTGVRFGKIVVQKMIYSNGQQTRCECLCDCGTVFTTLYSCLKDGNTRSCGCTSSPNLIGIRFGRLTVVDEVESTTPQRLWMCKCDCGTYTYVHSYTLTSGHTMSCGCLRSEAVSKGETKIAETLNNLAIEYEREKKFVDCKGIGGKPLRFDFYIPDKGLLIEYDGIQHIKPIMYFGGDDKYNAQVANDKIKNDYCLEHGIPLIRIPYTDNLQDLENKIKNIFQNPVTTTVV